MSIITNPSVSPGNLMPEQRDAMRKLLASQTFASSPRLREVLAHLIAALEGDISEGLSEQSIGHDVFGKPLGYNASEDNIVRVTIRHLRTRLDDYYESEGKGDAWVLSIPKGKYVPSLVLAGSRVSTADKAVPPPIVLEMATPISLSLREEPHGKSWRNTTYLTAAACLIFAIGLAGGYLFRGTSVAPSSTGGVIGQLCRRGDDLSVVVVDANLQAYRQIFRRQVSLDDYIHRSYAKEPVATTDQRVLDAQRYATGSNETNVSSAILAAALRRDLPGRHIEIKHPHDVSVRDFQEQKTTILLGGPYSNPWGQLFEAHFNFRLLPAESAPASSRIQNLNPRPNEARDYTPHADGNLDVNYVRIAIVPNFEQSGRVVLMGATSADSLEAAGTYLLSDESVSDLKSLFHVRSIGNLPSIEFVLETRGLNSVPNSHRILSERLVTYGSNR